MVNKKNGSDVLADITTILSLSFGLKQPMTPRYLPINVVIVTTFEKLFIMESIVISRPFSSLRYPDGLRRYLFLIPAESCRQSGLQDHRLHREPRSRLHCPGQHLPL